MSEMDKFYFFLSKFKLQSFHLAHRNCNFSIVGEVFAEQPYALAVQQGSLLAEELSKTILLLQKDRFFDELKAKYWNTSALCREDDDSEGITLESLGGIFIATIVGLGELKLKLSSNSSLIVAMLNSQ